MPAINVWQQLYPAQTRVEAHFGDRVVRCFPDRPANLDAMLRQTVARFPEHEALVFEQQRINYRELDRLVDATAVRFHAAGLQTGERIAVYMSNSIALIVAYFAAMRAGLIAVPIGIRQQAPELEYALNNCTAAALVFDSDSVGRLPARERIPTLRHYYCVGGPVANAEPFEALMAATDETAPLLDIDEESTAFIMYTSGTTGRPKGAELCHLGVWHATKHDELCLEFNDRTRAVLAIPGTHVSGLVAIIMSIAAAGGCLAVMRSFDTRGLLHLMRAEKITATLFVPTIYTRILLEPDFDSFELGMHWRSARYGGAPMPEATIAGLHKHLPNLRLHQGYGATESGAVSVLLPADQTALRPFSVGTAEHCVDVFIADEQGRELPFGEIGEIWIGGASVVRGYWNMPEENARSFIGGYWRSGDVGTMDEQGYLQILDRRKDVIIRGGFKVYSVEVENVLAFVEGVVEAAVVPSPCPLLGERVHAFLYAPGVGEDAVREFCATRLADYKIPDFITLSPEPLPRNLNGKLVKAPLRDIAKVEAEQRNALKAR